MKVDFKKPVSLGGVNYSKGVHQVPDSMASHWYLLALCVNQKATIVEKSKGAKAAVEEVPPTPQDVAREKMAVRKARASAPKVEAKSDKKDEKKPEKEKSEKKGE